MLRTLASPEREGDLLTLELLDLAPGEEFGRESSLESVAVILSGRVEVHAAGRSLGQAGARPNVFEGPGFGVYAPPGVTVALTAITAAELAIASAPLDEWSQPPDRARIIRPEDQRIADVGRDNWRRTVRTMLGPEHAAGRLLLGETINPPGNWSSYPPHRHDRQNPPAEVLLREIYFFKLQPSSGFGVQLVYDEPPGASAVVRDGDVALIHSGYHPVVAAPGYSLYYLWIMAGDGRVMAPYVEPEHRWVQDQ